MSSIMMTPAIVPVSSSLSGGASASSPPPAASPRRPPSRPVSSAPTSASRSPNHFAAVGLRSKRISLGGAPLAPVLTGDAAQRPKFFRDRAARNRARAKKLGLFRTSLQTEGADGGVVRATKSFLTDFVEVLSDFSDYEPLFKELDELDEEDDAEFDVVEGEGIMGRSSRIRPRRSSWVGERRPRKERDGRRSPPAVPRNEKRSSRQFRDERRSGTKSDRPGSSSQAFRGRATASRESRQHLRRTLDKKNPTVPAEIKRGSAGSASSTVIPRPSILALNDYLALPAATRRGPMLRAAATNSLTIGAPVHSAVVSREAPGSARLGLGDRTRTSTGPRMSRAQEHRGTRRKSILSPERSVFFAEGRTSEAYESEIDFGDDCGAATLSSCRLLQAESDEDEPSARKVAAIESSEWGRDGGCGNANEVLLTTPETSCWGQELSPVPSVENSSLSTCVAEDDDLDNDSRRYAAIRKRQEESISPGRVRPNKGSGQKISTVDRAQLREDLRNGKLAGPFFKGQREDREQDSSRSDDEDHATVPSKSKSDEDPAVSIVSTITSSPHKKQLLKVHHLTVSNPELFTDQKLFTDRDWGLALVLRTAWRSASPSRKEVEAVEQRRSRIYAAVPKIDDGKRRSSRSASRRREERQISSSHSPPSGPKEFSSDEEQHGLRDDARKYSPLYASLFAPLSSTEWFSSSSPDRAMYTAAPPTHDNLLDTRLMFSPYNFDFVDHQTSSTRSPLRTRYRPFPSCLFSHRTPRIVKASAAERSQTQHLSSLLGTAGILLRPDGDTEDAGTCAKPLRSRLEYLKQVSLAERRDAHRWNVRMKKARFFRMRTMDMRKLNKIKKKLRIFAPESDSGSDDSEALRKFDSPRVGGKRIAAHSAAAAGLGGAPATTPEQQQQSSSAARRPSTRPSVFESLLEDQLLADDVADQVRKELAASAEDPDLELRRRGGAADVITTQDTKLGGATGAEQQDPASIRRITRKTLLKSSAATRLQRVTERVRERQAAIKKAEFEALPFATRTRLSYMYYSYYIPQREMSHEVEGLTKCLIELGVGGLFISETVIQRKFAESFHRKAGTSGISLEIFGTDFLNGARETLADFRKTRAIQLFYRDNGSRLRDGGGILPAGDVIYLLKLDALGYKYHLPIEKEMLDILKRHVIEDYIREESSDEEEAEDAFWAKKKRALRHAHRVTGVEGRFTLRRISLGIPPVRR